MGTHPSNLTKLLGRTLAVLFLFVLLAIPAVAGAQSTPQPQPIHVVLQGETLYGIAAQYGVMPSALLSANNLSRAGQIRPGMRLLVPAAPGQTGQVHIVHRGETLSMIAARYGVTIADLILANNLKDANKIFSGQRLLVPVPDEQPPLMPTPPPLTTGTPSIMPSPAATATPTIAATPGLDAGCLTSCEMISILEPGRGVTITHPFTVTGFGAAPDQRLVVRVLDSAGYEIGLGSAAIDGPSGEIGMFQGVIRFAVPANPQPGRIQIYSLSPKDGAIEHLSSVVVNLPGSGLDQTIEQVKQALEAKDTQALALAMTDPWSLAFYQSEGMSLSIDQALRQLEDTYLGPGNVFVDLSVDARKVLADQTLFSPNVTHVVYSTGWGPDQVDDAFLLFETDETGQTRWGGMLYVFDALKDYAVSGSPGE